MKKSLFCILATIFFAAPLFAEIEPYQECIIRFSMQPQGTFGYRGDNNTNFGISTGFEYFRYITEILALGGGTVYETPRSFQDELDGSISFMPFYAALKLRPPLKNSKTFFPFFVAKLGYSPLITYGTDWLKSSSGGTYYSFGAGLNINVIILEASYSANTVNFTEKTTNKKFTDLYSTFSITIGYKFN